MRLRLCWLSKNQLEWQCNPTSCLTYWPDVASAHSLMRTEVYQDIRQTDRRREREWGSAVQCSCCWMREQLPPHHRWFICKFSLLSADYKVTHDMTIWYQHGNITTVHLADDWTEEYQTQNFIIVNREVLATSPALLEPIKTAPV